MLQPGSVPVEGFSNPTWVAVLAVGRALHLFDHGSWSGTPDLVLYPKLIALLCCFGGSPSCSRSRAPCRGDPSPSP